VYSKGGREGGRKGGRKGWREPEKEREKGGAESDKTCWMRSLLALVGLFWHI
jgi:hypothetical protein